MQLVGRVASRFPELQLLSPSCTLQPRVACCDRELHAATPSCMLQPRVARFNPELHVATPSYTCFSSCPAHELPKRVWGGAGHEPAECTEVARLTQAECTPSCQSRPLDLDRSKRAQRYTKQQQLQQQKPHHFRPPPPPPTPTPAPASLFSTPPRLSGWSSRVGCADGYCAHRPDATSSAPKKNTRPRHRLPLSPAALLLWMWHRRVLACVVARVVRGAELFAAVVVSRGSPPS